MWKAIVTVAALTATALTFGGFFVLTGNEATLAISAAAGGAMASYLGRLNGSS